MKPKTLVSASTAVWVSRLVVYYHEKSQKRTFLRTPSDDLLRVDRNVNKNVNKVTGLPRSLEFRPLWVTEQLKLSRINLCYYSDLSSSPLTLTLTPTLTFTFIYAFLCLPYLSSAAFSNSFWCVLIQNLLINLEREQLKSLQQCSRLTRNCKLRTIIKIKLDLKSHKLPKNLDDKDVRSKRKKNNPKEFHYPLVRETKWETKKKMENL